MRVGAIVLLGACVVACASKSNSNTASGTNGSVVAPPAFGGGTGGVPALGGGSGGASASSGGGGGRGTGGIGAATGTGGATMGGGGGLGTGGMSMGAAGMSAGTAGMAAGSGGRSMGAAGMGTAGMGGSGAGSGGTSGSCTPNLACTLAALPSSGDIRQDCVDRINQFRTQCACVPALARWTDGEACADQMAQYDSTMPSSPHAGFMARICSGGSAQDECPGWGSNAQVVSGCLQSMWNEGPPPSQPCTGQCFQDHGHFINMSNTAYTKVACGFYTTSAGKVWAVQNFSR